MEDFVPTRGSQIKKNTINDYISVNYEAPKKKTKHNLDDKRKDDVESKLTPAELKKQQEKEFKKAQFDIVKLGISGFNKSKKKRAKIDLAISLGAIAPKNRRINYRVLQMRQKKEKEKKKEEEHISGFTNSLRKSKSKSKSKSKIVRKKDSDILAIYGKVPKDALSTKN